MPPPTSTLTGTSTPAYSFSLTFAPNGDVLTANDDINGNWNYAYDQFNRLTCSNLSSNGTCASPTSGTPTYSYVYDRFGNRWQQNGQFSFSASFTGNSPAQPANNNRMDGYTYDAAGNLLSDGNHTYFYDAENRLIQVDGTLGTCSSGGTAGTTACYYYDAEGHRVWRTGFTSDTCDATGKRGYVFDLAGHWVAEINGNGGGCNGEIYAGSRHVASGYDGDIMLDHTDWLGTSRLRTDYQYTTSHGFWIGQSCTSLPFGDATSCHGGEGSSPLVFTGKELDNESGLDNFGARFDSSSMGRFTSPDPLYLEMHRLTDPQQLNLYSYVRNNPPTLTDPDGRDIAVKCADKTNCTTATDQVNARKDGQFKVEIGKDGKWHPIGEVDVSKLSGAEKAFYNALSDTNTHATLTAVSGDGSVFFGLSTGKGTNTVDVADTAQLSSAGLSPGTAVAHEAMEAYATAGGASLSDAHNNDPFPGFTILFGGGHAIVSDGNVTGYQYFLRYNGTGAKYEVNTTLKTAIPVTSLVNPQTRAAAQKAMNEQVTSVIPK